IARLEHNRFIERPAVATLVVFADEDAKKHRVAGQGHECAPWACSKRARRSRLSRQRRYAEEPEMQPKGDHGPQREAQHNGADCRAQIRLWIDDAVLAIPRI